LLFYVQKPLLFFFFYFNLGSNGINANTYDCAPSNAVVGCTNASLTITCICNTDLCNKSGGHKSNNVNIFVLTAVTFASVAFSIKLM
jgi:hypothetical protein